MSFGHLRIFSAGKKIREDARKKGTEARPAKKAFGIEPKDFCAGIAVPFFPQKDSTQLDRSKKVFLKKVCQLFLKPDRGQKVFHIPTLTGVGYST
jgi:hypothetical protein|tara:strand:- start:891 stop:1175 length:285 start_codon:yes stop_codon:yes gene_type:complete